VVYAVTAYEPWFEAERGNLSEVDWFSIRQISAQWINGLLVFADIAQH
jgi:hypothetical protein